MTGSDGYAVQWDGVSVRLPAARDGEVDFSSWGEAEAALRHFLTETTGGNGTTSVFLVRHPDNEHNPLAISVARPPAYTGEPPEDRHLGYLYDSYLRKIGPGTLPRLAQHAPAGEIEATLSVEDDFSSLALPDPDLIRRAVEEFVGRADLPALAARPVNRHTVECLERLAPDPDFVVWEPGALALSASGDAPLRLRVTSPATGEGVAGVHDGLLTVVDEPDRAAVLDALRAHGIRVMEPVGGTADVPARDVPHPSVVFFGAHAHVEADAESGLVNDTLRFAHYIPGNQVLYVEDEQLVPVARFAIERHGLAVDSVRVPVEPWMAEAEFGYHTLFGHDAPSSRLGLHDITENHFLLPHLRDVLPAGIEGAVPLTWRAAPAPRTRPEPDQVRVFEPLFTDRTTMFGPIDLTGERQRCRLCGRDSAAFRAACSEDVLAYCYTCRHAAAEGSLGSTADAARAVRVIAETEFDGQPLLPPQLGRIDRLAGSPRTAVDVDRALLLRMFIPRRATWTSVLAAAGLLSGGVRTSRGVVIAARDGHLCGSMLEKQVDDFLHDKGIDHEREPLYPAHPALNRHRSRADWRLADGTYVELWGMPNDPVYAEKMARKRLLAAALEIAVVELLPEDVHALTRAFGRWLSPARGTTS